MSRCIRCLVRNLALASLCLAEPSFAAERPYAEADPRIKVVDYDPRAVVPITGVYRTATEILLGEDESILHVAVGDATAWDVAVEKNILFLKPKADRGSTNLIITTARPAGARHYIFELSTSAGPANGKTAPVFVLRFRYPTDEKTTAIQAISAETAALEKRVIALKLDRAVLEGRRNLDYAVQGAGALQPSEVSDNGRFTVLRFPANQQLPALYEVEASGTESLVPFDVRGEFVVVHAVVRELRLRRGKAVLCIYNQGFEPYGVTPATRTAAPDVDRTDKGAIAP